MGPELEDEASKSPDEAIRQILDYFLRHPEAVDSAEGIAHWRLLEEAVQPSLTEADEGLRWLAAHGYLREVAVPGSRHVYTLNPDMQQRARRLLEDRREPEES